MTVESGTSTTGLSSIILQALAIVVLASVVGLAVNLVRNERIPFIARQNDFVSEKKGEASITVQEAKAKFDEGTGFFVDARSEEDFRKAHILNALNISEEEFDGVFERVKPLIPAAGEFTVIVYCSGGECEASNKVAEKLRADGYTNVRVFSDGWNAWLRAGYPIEESTS